MSRPGGTDVEAYTIKSHAIQDICNKQQFGSGQRHYLGVQWTLWDGQLIITMLITVTVLHETLRIEITGHALGPVNSLFTSKPEAPTKEVAKAVKFWETRKVKLPLVTTDEVVRLTARPLTGYPPLLNWLGGKLTLPEPFGLRHAWSRPALAAPLHGRRRAAGSHTGAACRARGGDQGAGRERGRHGEVRQPVGVPQHGGAGPVARKADLYDA